VVKIRLQRYGAKNNPFYRIVVADSESPRDGRFIEQLGYYDSVKYSAPVTVKEDRVQYWLSQGARPTQTVAGLLKKKGLIQAK